MTPQQLNAIRARLRDVSDESLGQFFVLVVAQMHTREPTIKFPATRPLWQDLMDCNPIRGD